MKTIIKDWRKEVSFTNKDIDKIKSIGVFETTLIYSSKIADFCLKTKKQPGSTSENQILYNNDKDRFFENVSIIRESIGKLFYMGRYIDKNYVQKEGAKNMWDITDGHEGKYFGDWMANLLGPAHQFSHFFELNEHFFFIDKNEKLEYYKEELVDAVINSIKRINDFAKLHSENFYHL